MFLFLGENCLIDCSTLYFMENLYVYHLVSHGRFVCMPVRTPGPITLILCRWYESETKDSRRTVILFIKVALYLIAFKCLLNTRAI